MTRTLARLETSTDDHAPGPDILIRWLEARQQSTIHLEHQMPLGPFGKHTEAAEDLFAIAVTAYCADRSILREAQADAWTRHIEIDVPVSDPDRLDQDSLEGVLSFLTGDYWSIRLRPGQPNPGLSATSLLTQPADSVTLFSGGVDSLAGALELLELAESTLLVSYFGDGSTGRLQQFLARDLGSADQHYRFRVVGSSAGAFTDWPGFVDSTMRSRSLLFIALGLLVARTHLVDQLQMAENGYIALNVPLHAGRVGSLSTRTAHPQFVNGLNETIAAADLGANIVNPYLLMTKGEVTERLDALAPDLAPLTISCARPTAARWTGRGFRNCGYCYPCIIRRAGFHHAGNDQTHYWIDPFTDVGFYWDGVRPRDIRSVARFLLEPASLGDVMATGKLGTFDMAQELHRMHERGATELNDLFSDRASNAVLDELGL